MKHKQGKADIKAGQKKNGKSHFRYKVYNIIDRNYELIRRFKTTTASLHDSYANLSEKMKWFTGTKDTLEQNQKIIMQLMQHKDVIYSFLL